MSISPEYARAPHGLLLRPIITVVPVPNEGESLIPSENQLECGTPTGKEFKLPVVPPSCPPAPRKPLRAIRCKRRLSELAEFIVVRREEMESLFRRRDDDDHHDDSLQIAKKRKSNGE